MRQHKIKVQIIVSQAIVERQQFLKMSFKEYKIQDLKSQMKRYNLLQSCLLSYLDNRILHKICNPSMLPGIQETLIIKNTL